jgi:hypothetical protein
VLEIGVSGLLGGDVRSDVGFGGSNGGLLGVDISGLLHIFDLRKCFALFYTVTLFHVEAGDAAHDVGADVDVGSWLDLAGTADDGRQILFSELGGEDLGVAGCWR